MSEVDLYPLVKQHLESQGYLVKGEIGACDLLALRGSESPVIVELKEQLNLALLLQAADRLAVTSTVYMAFRVGKGQSATWRTRRKRVVNLARRLGLGILTISSATGVQVALEPGPYRPRHNRRREARLLKEFHGRDGDPESGGSAAKPRMTHYRQQAIRCGQELRGFSELKLGVLRQMSGVERAGAILRDNHYGWFERKRQGHYALTAKGHAELPQE